MDSMYTLLFLEEVINERYANSELVQSFCDNTNYGFGSCLDDSITSESNEEIEIQEDFWDSYSVVAPVDTGINPYHDHFQKNQSLPQSFLDDFGVTMTCELTQTGTWEEKWKLIGNVLESNFVQ